MIPSRRPAPPATFRAQYANAYDLLYAEKDYTGECDVLQRALAEFGSNLPGTILDIGCGTGGHAIPFARQGHAVVGLDSSPDMLNAAARKADAAGVAHRLTLLHADIGSPLDLPRCEAAIMMFIVIGYIADQQSLANALANVRRCLPPGGVFLFDFWYGPAVEAQPPQQTWRLIERDEERVIRLTSAELDRQARVCSVTFRLLRIVGGHVIDESSEDHRVRYFHVPELRSLLDAAGLELLHVGGFPDYRADPGDGWTAFAAARVSG
jgi:SAM-dependent methyltransferase